MKIIYRNAWTAWQDFDTMVLGVLEDPGVRTIAEVGAGANPMLPPDLIRSRELSYHLIDSSRDELKKAASGFHQHVVDFGRPGTGVNELPSFDLLFSRMTLEHVQRPASFLTNISALLRPGGYACLFFAVPTNLPLFINKILPDTLTARLVRYIQPFRKNEKHGKFPAYYRWCYGPTGANIYRLQSTGLDIIEYTGFFGHSYYQRSNLLQRLENRKTRYLLRHPNPWLCTYAQVLLRKPVMKADKEPGLPCW